MRADVKETVNVMKFIRLREFFVQSAGKTGALINMHAQAPAPPGNPVLHVAVSPPRGYQPYLIALPLT
ncbi:hypothetical protein NQZ68_026982 [Dissostichus eleginoides]|nr:hypothetical protein NQZ68_026982 [Dissostichus eleginoides]